ncbi:hypothetical protein JCM8097_001224 [Rhodosporidiobolus ruineniae]
MPRPPSSALARPRSLSSSVGAASSAAPCTCRAASAPAQPRPAPTRNASTTSTAAPSSSAAPDSPVLDFLYPTFGFFSRSLPTPRTPLSADLSFVLAPPHPHSFAGPPPPPPQPQPQAFDVRSWRQSEGFVPVGLSSTSTSTRRTLGGAGGTIAAPRAGTAVARCICGRVRQTCLRCRASSTAAATRARFDGEEATAGRPGEADGARSASGKGKERAVETAELEGAARLGSAEGMTPTRRQWRQRRKAEKAGERESQSPSERLRHLLVIHAPNSLPNLRGSTVSSSSTPPSTAASIKRAEASRVALWEAADEPTFVEALSVQEKLDLVRAFSIVARSVPLGAPTDPLDSTTPSPHRSSIHLLRMRSTRHMLDLLSRFSFWSSDPSKPSSLASTSSTHTAAALLYLDASTMDSDLSALNAALAPSTSDDSRGPASLAALEAVFRPRPLPFGLDAEQRERREYNRREDQRTAAALLLDAWDRTSANSPEPVRPASRASEQFEEYEGLGDLRPAEQALRLFHGWGVSRLLEIGPGDTPRQVGFAHVLQRRYGVVLSRLSVNAPVDWIDQLVARGHRDEVAGHSDGRNSAVEPVGLHVVRYLARSGSAKEALRVYGTVERLRNEGFERYRAEQEAEGEKVKPLRFQQQDSRFRLTALTALVDGLTQERLLEDADRLRPALEALARAVEAEHDATDASSDGELSPKAYGVLAKLAARQGNSNSTEQYLERLAAVQPDRSFLPSSSSSFASLTPAARRIQVRAANHDIDAVQALFDSVRSSLDTASPADRARLWSQLVLAQARVNDVEAAVQSLMALVAAGLEAPRSAINAVLYGYARRADVKTTFELFAQVLDGVFPRVEPDASGWTALVLACSNARDPTRAAEIVGEMKAVGVAPNRQTWTTLMSAFVETGQWIKVFEIFRFLESHPDPLLRPDTAVVNIMLKACVLTAVPAQDVLRLFQNLVAGGIRPDMSSYTLVFHSLCSAGLLDLASELFVLLDEASQHAQSVTPLLPVSKSSLKPDQFIFATLIGGHLAHGQPEKARVYLNEMRARGIAPTSVTTLTVLSARLKEHHARGQAWTAAGIRAILKQTRAFLEDEALTVRRKRQPVKLDRDVARHQEAMSMFVQVIRALGRSQHKVEALAVFEEALDVRRSGKGGADDSGPLPIELYTSFMDALRRHGDMHRESIRDEAARDVLVVWNRIYDLVVERFVRLRLGQSGSPTAFASKRLVDPAHASILCVPFSIFLQTLSAVEGREVIIETTWRKLAEQGFAFDVSNWNVLAQYFARDLQLERALWIVEHVLSRPARNFLDPASSSTRSPAAAASDPTAAFFHDLAAVRRSAALGRSPVRLRQLRQWERDRQRKYPLHLDSYFADLVDSEQAGEKGTDEADGAPSPSPLDAFTAVFSRSYERRAATIWHPFSATLDAIDTALETLTAQGTQAAWQSLVEARSRAEKRFERTLETWVEEDEVDSPSRSGALHALHEARRLYANADEEPLPPVPEDATEVRAELLRRYPRAAEALEFWRRRHERKAQRRAAYEQRMAEGRAA